MYNIVKKVEGRPRAGPLRITSMATPRAGPPGMLLSLPQRGLQGIGMECHHIAVILGSGSCHHNRQLQGHNTTAVHRHKCALYPGSGQWDSGTLSAAGKIVNKKPLCLLVGRTIQPSPPFPSQCSM